MQTTFLENALKTLKEKMEELAVENESIRAEVEASIQGLQLKLKQWINLDSIYEK